MFSRQLGNRLLLRPFTTHKLPPPLKNAASIPQGEREAPEPLPEAAHDIWTREQQGLEYKPPKGKETDWFHHPLYSPPADPETGIGPMIAPLKWPEFDQKVLSAQESGFANNWTKYEFDSPTAPIGNYPRDIPLQWTQLKDPFKQGRRNYGDVLADHDQFTDWLSPGPEVSWKKPFANLVGLLGLFALMGLGVSAWDPVSHRYWTPREFPFDGLRVELGGDPEDEKDNWMAAHSVKSA